MSHFRSAHSLRQTPEIEALTQNTWEELGPGVFGYRNVMEDGTVYFGVIEAAQEGNGDVGRFLDSLPTDTTFRIAYVINPRLEGMLVRRKWTTFYEWFDLVEETVLVYERKATT